MYKGNHNMDIRITVLSQYHSVDSIKLCSLCHSEACVQEVGLHKAGQPASGLLGIIKEQNSDLLTVDSLEYFRILGLLPPVLPLCY